MTTQDDRAKVRENHAKIRQVPCPQCGVPRFAPCKGPSGRQVLVHQARRHAAAQAGVYVPGGAP